jgi:uncharacterized membrane protein
MKADNSTLSRRVEKARLEAFSDGVIAIILTIMVLDLKVPQEPTIEGLQAMWPIYVAYALSYGNVFFVWINHHNIFSSLKEVDVDLLWTNGVLLFFVSLVPFVTAFGSASHWTAPLPAVLYGLNMAAVSLGFVRLRRAAGRIAVDPAAVAHQRAEALFSLTLVVTFVIGALCAWFMPRSALVLYAIAPFMRFITRYRMRHTKIPAASP